MAYSMLLLGALAALPVQTSEPPHWRADRYAATVTECDRQIAHPDDPHRIAPGVSQASADLPRAITACEAAVRADPENPRLNYQLARAYGYSGAGAKAYPYRDKAVAGGYPQALFVVGYITLLGLNQQPRDVCKGGELIRASALAGRLAGQIGYPHYALNGLLKACPRKLDRAELLAMLAAAKTQAKDDFYKGTLIERLEADVRALPED